MTLALNGIDLRQCKNGDRVLLRRGTEGRYYSCGDPENHYVFVNDILLSYRQDGKELCGCPAAGESNYDIVAILGPQKEDVSESTPYVGIPGDADKPRPALLHSSMARAVAAVIRVLTYGAKKHSPDGWADVEDVDRVYLEKIYRHLSAEALGDDIEPESGELHAACVAADAMIRLEMRLRERERRYNSP